MINLSTPEEDRRLSERNGRIWREYCAGSTQTALAAKYQISQGRVSEIIAQVRASIPDVSREDEIQRSLEMLHDLRAGAVEIYELAPAPVFVGKDGVPAYDPETGQVVRDYTGKLRALDSALKVDKRIAELLGLDAAAKVDLNMTGSEREAAERLAAEAARRVAGEPS